MTALNGPFIIAASLLVVAGTSKIRNPSAPGEALRAIGAPSSSAVGLVVGLLEVALGAGALATGAEPLVAAVAVAYLAFAGFVVAARRRGGARSCGCFGVDEAPPSRLHVLVDVVLAGGCAAAAVAGADPLGDVLADQPAAGLPLVLAAGTAVYLVRALLTDLVATRDAAGALT